MRWGECQASWFREGDLELTIFFCFFASPPSRPRVFGVEKTINRHMYPMYVTRGTGHGSMAETKQRGDKNSTSTNITNKKRGFLLPRPFPLCPSLSRILAPPLSQRHPNSPKVHVLPVSRHAHNLITQTRPYTHTSISLPRSLTNGTMNSARRFDHDTGRDMMCSC